MQTLYKTTLSRLVFSRFLGLNLACPCLGTEIKVQKNWVWKLGKRIFLMGKQSNIEYNVSAEQEIHRDILQADFEESFNNLTYKDFIFLNWLKTENCHSK